MIDWHLPGTSNAEQVDRRLIGSAERYVATEWETSHDSRLTIGIRRVIRERSVFALERVGRLLAEPERSGSFVGDVGYVDVLAGDEDVAQHPL